MDAIAHTNARIVIAQCRYHYQYHVTHGSSQTNPSKPPLVRGGLKASP